MSLDIDVDARRVVAGMRKFATNLPRATNPVGYEQARRTARQVAALTPVRTGRLRSTVGAQPVDRGGQVTYGDALRYAPVIERRQHPVQRGVSGSDREYQTAMTRAAEQEVGNL